MDHYMIRQELNPENMQIRYETKKLTMHPTTDAAELIVNDQR